MILLGVLHDSFEGVDSAKPFCLAGGAKKLDRRHISLGDLAFAREFGLIPILVARVLKIQVGVHQSEARHHGGPKGDKHCAEPSDHDTIGRLQVSVPNMGTVEPPGPPPEQEPVADQP